MNKKISIEIAVGIIVLVALAFGGYVIFITKKVEAPTNITNQSKTECEKKYSKECNLTLENGWQPINPNDYPTGNNKNSEIANPASVYCEQKGGKLEIQTAANGGQNGICTLSNGTKCEEWAFMRGECKGNSVVDNIDWKIYQNEKYGFKVEYPKNWIVKVNGNAVIFNSPETDKIITNLVENKIGADAIPDLGVIYYEKLSDEYNFNAGDYQTLKEYLEKSGSFSNIQEIMLSNKKAWFVKDEGEIILYSIYVEYNNHLYVIYFGKEWLFGKTENFSSLPEISKNFISTFKFLD